MSKEDQDAAEKRAGTRVRVVAYMRGQSEHTETFLFVRDLSEAGAFLLSDRKPEIGTRLALQLSLHFVSARLDVEAEVTRVGAAGYAVKFISMSDTVRKHLREHVAAGDDR